MNTWVVGYVSYRDRALFTSVCGILFLPLLLSVSLYLSLPSRRSRDAYLLIEYLLHRPLVDLQMIGLRRDTYEKERRDCYENEGRVMGREFETD